jgi:hypothetical protein
MVFFLKKKEIPKSLPPPISGGPNPMGEYIPIEQVRNMASQGLPESEIAGRLQAQGFSPIQIDRALRNAIREEVAGPPPGMRPRPMPPQQMPPQQIPLQMRGLPPQPMRQMPQRQIPMGYPPERIIPPTEPRATFLSAPPSEEQAFTFERTEQRPVMFEKEITLEEVIEGVVADKWEDFEDRLGAFEKRDMQIQNQVNDLRKKIEELERIQREKEQTLGMKFDEFGESVSGIEGRIGSIEKIFKDFLPELTENIRIMSSLIEKKNTK